MKRIDAAVGLSVGIAGLVFLGVFLQSDLFDRIATGFRLSEEARVEKTAEKVRAFAKEIVENLEGAQLKAGELKKRIQDDATLHNELSLRSTQAVKSLQASVAERLDELDGSLNELKQTQSEVLGRLDAIVTKLEDLQSETANLKKRWYPQQ